MGLIRLDGGQYRKDIAAKAARGEIRVPVRAGKAGV
jgi:hypothetical protein